MVQLNEGPIADGLQAILFVSCSGRQTACARTEMETAGRLDVMDRQGPSLKSILEWGLDYILC